jgi:NH3-dependent NAD+ synthetase
MKLDLVESYWIIDDIFHALLKNRSLFTNHTLSNQIQFSLDMFLKKSDFMRIMPPTNEEVLAELPYMKLSTIL